MLRKFHIFSSLLALALVVLGCNGLGKGKLQMDEAYRFPGLTSLLAGDSGTYHLGWETVPVPDVIYRIYLSPSEGTIDESKPWAVTSNSGFTTGDLRFQDNLCFVVRYHKEGVVRDTNFSRKCTAHERVIFSGVTSLSPNGDGTWTIGWQAISGQDFSYQVFESPKPTGFHYGSPRGMTSESSFQTDAVPLGSQRCYDVRMLQGARILFQNMKVMCTPAVDLHPFKGVEESTSPTPGIAEITWTRSESPDVRGYRVYEAGSDVPVAETDGTASKARIEGLRSGKGYVFTVKAIGANGVEDGNRRVLSVVPDGTRRAGSAAQLAFFTQPAPVVEAGDALPVSPQVVVQDSEGQLAQSGVYSVQLSAYLDEACQIPALGNLRAHSTQVSTTSGVASFVSVSYDAPGTIYLGARATGLRSACSRPLRVDVGRVSRLAFAQAPPALVTAAAPFSQDPVIEIQDKAGNRVVGSSLTVQLHAFLDPLCTIAAPGVLSGGGSQLAVGGRASFPGVSFTKASTIYLRGSASGVTPICSEAVTVHVGPPASFVPRRALQSFATIGQDLPDQPSFELLDAGGNTVTSHATAVTLTAWLDATCTTPCGSWRSPSPHEPRFSGCRGCFVCPSSIPTPRYPERACRERRVTIPMPRPYHGVQPRHLPLGNFPTTLGNGDGWRSAWKLPHCRSA